MDVVEQEAAAAVEAAFVVAFVVPCAVSGAVGVGAGRSPTVGALA